MSRATLYCGDALTVLQALPEESVQCVVTSPPYFGLRDYGIAGQLGGEASPADYVARLVDVFRGVWRVLCDDGVVWLNLGDSYAAHPGQRKATDVTNSPKQQSNAGSVVIGSRSPMGCKPKDLIGIPWMTAFALRADGWWLRSDVVWAKPNGMPESVQDRPTRSHEYLFQLTKSATYFYDADAARTPMEPSSETRLAQDRKHDGFNDRWDAMEKSERRVNGANLRSVWWIAPAQYRDAHFAVMPEKLVTICIAAGSRPGDCVLDPFGGSGTVASVATGMGRRSIYIDLNPAYMELAKQRIGPMLCEVA